jgi:putative FmdB family regulatory protein
VPALACGLREGGSVPTYQYACTECGEQLEAVQKFSDAPLTVCDNCGGRLRKVFSPVGIVFKGSGFYRTDSRKGSSAAAPATAKETTEKPASGATESKPAEKVSTSSSTASSSTTSEKVA